MPCDIAVSMADLRKCQGHHTEMPHQSAGNTYTRHKNKNTETPHTGIAGVTGEKENLDMWCNTGIQITGTLKEKFVSYDVMHFMG